MRLHSGILAGVAGTPAVTIDYDPKTQAFARQTGQGWWAVEVDHLEASAAGSERGAGAHDLYEAIVDTVSDLPARRAALARAVAPLRAEAGRTAGLAVQLASRRRAGAGTWPVATEINDKGWTAGDRLGYRRPPGGA